MLPCPILSNKFENLEKTILYESIIYQKTPEEIGHLNKQRKLRDNNVIAYFYFCVCVPFTGRGGGGAWRNLQNNYSMGTANHTSSSKLIRVVIF